MVSVGAPLISTAVAVMAVLAVFISMQVLQNRGGDPDIDPKTGYCWRGYCWHGHRAQTREEVYERMEINRKHTGAYDVAKKCWNASLWHEKFGKQERWSFASQRWADSVLASLFADTNLGTTNKFVVEFGFDQAGFEANDGGGSNSMMMRRQLGWKGVNFDIEFEVPSENLWKEFITPATVVSIFRKHNVPREADYISIDIDSCDLWVFMNLTAEAYRPRVVSVEYNAGYALEQSKTILCEQPDGEVFSWPALGYGQIYGSSFRALHKAAKMRGYTVVYSVFLNDVFMVRSDLVCEGSDIDIEKFRADTGESPIFPPSQLKDYAKWVVDF